jgi:hypothetical protein
MDASFSARSVRSDDGIIRFDSAQGPIINAQSVPAQLAPKIEKSRRALDPLVVESTEHRLNGRARLRIIPARIRVLGLRAGDFGTELNVVPVEDAGQGYQREEQE